MSRFSSRNAAARIERAGIRVVRAELGDSDAVAGLPDAANVIYMAGQKFGTRDLPSLTWAVSPHSLATGHFLSFSVTLAQLQRV